MEVKYFSILYVIAFSLVLAVKSLHFHVRKIFQRFMNIGNVEEQKHEPRARSEAVETNILARFQ